MLFAILKYIHFHHFDIWYFVSQLYRPSSVAAVKCLPVLATQSTLLTFPILVVAVREIYFHTPWPPWKCSIVAKVSGLLRCWPCFLETFCSFTALHVLSSNLQLHHWWAFSRQNTSLYNYTLYKEADLWLAEWHSIFRKLSSNERRHAFPLNNGIIVANSQRGGVFA